MIELTFPTGALSVLALGAHPDDIEIGCGGTLLRLAARGGVVFHHLIMTGTEERREEARRAASRLVGRTEHSFADLPDGSLPAHWGAVKSRLEESASAFHADVVFTPRRDDAHQDHRLLAELAPTVWRDALVLEYEIPKWDGDRGRANVYLSLPGDVAYEKVRILNECFPSQVGRDWWDDEMFLGAMRLRGIECRSQYAEAFVCSKALLELR